MILIRKTFSKGKNTKEAIKKANKTNRIAGAIGGAATGAALGSLLGPQAATYGGAFGAMSGYSGAKNQEFFRDIKWGKKKDLEEPPREATKEVGPVGKAITVGIGAGIGGAVSAGHGIKKISEKTVEECLKNGIPIDALMGRPEYQAALKKYLKKAAIPGAIAGGALYAGLLALDSKNKKAIKKAYKKDLEEEKKNDTLKR